MSGRRTRASVALIIVLLLASDALSNDNSTRRNSIRSKKSSLRNRNVTPGAGRSGDGSPASTDATPSLQPEPPKPPAPFTDDLTDYAEEFRASPLKKPNIRFVRHRLNGIRCVLKESRSDEVRYHRALNVAGSGEQSSPFVLKLYHSFKTDSAEYAVLEYVDGSPLLNYVARGPVTEEFKPLEPAKICDVTAQLLLALRHVNRRGIMHNDVKPDNIMLSSGGRIVLLDFGLSRALPAPRHRYVGVAQGTPSYIAPEKMLRKYLGYDNTSDFFSVGVTFFALHCWYYPFDFEKFQDRCREFLKTGENVEPEFICDRLRADPTALDLALRLLDFDSTRRLGARGGVDEIMGHNYFRAGAMAMGRDPDAYWHHIESIYRTVEARELPPALPTASSPLQEEKIDADGVAKWLKDQWNTPEMVRTSSLFQDAFRNGYKAADVFIEHRRRKLDVQRQKTEGKSDESERKMPRDRRTSKRRQTRQRGGAATSQKRAPRHHHHDSARVGGPPADGVDVAAAKLARTSLFDAFRKTMLDIQQAMKEDGETTDN